MLPLRDGAPDLRAYEGREVLVGIRPESFADAAHEASTDGRHLFDARDLARAVDGLRGDRALRAGRRRGARQRTCRRSRVTQDDVAGRDQLSSAHQLVGRFDPRTKAAAGSTLTVSLDLERIHFFDPETEAAIR